MRIVAVAGPSRCTDDEAAKGYEVGMLLAQRKVALVCGGLGGVMEAACRGATDAGGLTIGLLPDQREAANPYVQIAIATGLGEARNVLVARAGEALIAVGGELGTLSEIAFAIKVGVPVVALDSWNLAGSTGTPVPGLRVAQTAAEAVDLALAGRR